MMTTKSKLIKSITILLILTLIVGCNTENKLDKDELEIVNKYINEKIFTDRISPIIIREQLERYPKNRVNLSYLESDSIVRKEVSERKFYITISDTLFFTEKNTEQYKGMAKAFVFFPLERKIEHYREINLRNLKIRNNLILVPSDKGINNSQYLGSFKISRVIFDTSKTRAFIYYKDALKKEKKFYPVNEFEKKDGIWQLKENFPR